MVKRFGDGNRQIPVEARIVIELVRCGSKKAALRERWEARGIRPLRTEQNLPVLVTDDEAYVFAVASLSADASITVVVLTIVVVIGRIAALMAFAQVVPGNRQNALRCCLQAIIEHFFHLPAKAVRGYRCRRKP
ncbi:hypothetical protein U8Q05_12695 [Rhizobium ruizarguesonis]|nr:hypothetical protein U8Q05_12695 [Rhizobium ruizarguesonis]